MNTRGLPAGQYDQRVTVWKNVPTTNSDGQRVENATEFIERWARVRPIGAIVGAQERFIAQQTKADVTHQVRMRSDTQTRTITPKMWLTLRDGTRLNIAGVIDVDVRKVELELECNQRI